MQTIVDQLAGSSNDAAVQTLSKVFNIEPNQAQAALKSILPELSGELERLTLSRGGIAGLVEMFGRASHEKVLDEPELAADPGVRAEGNELLGTIFGSKHKSRVVAQRASRDTSLSANALKQMLPVIAAMFMGGLEKQTRGQLADVAGKRPETRSMKAFGGDKFTGQEPLPVPGQNIPGVGRNSGGGQNPYRDLSDVIRKNGGRVGGNGSLANVIRNILGSVMGFQSNGIISWIIRVVVLRYGWSIVQFLVRRIFLGR